MLKQPTKFCALIADLMPQHFKFEREHALMALSAEELRLRLAEMLIASVVSSATELYPCWTLIC
jgi:hypothetical protein